MGACHCSSQSKEKSKKQSIKIGGGDDGQCTWTRYNKEDLQNLKTNTGWEMKFEVDEAGIISGGNKNDGQDNAIKKHYSGTYKEGKLDAVAEFEDGAQIKYDGKAEGNLMKVICTVIKGSSSFFEGDISQCQGTIKFL